MTRLNEAEWLIEPFYESQIRGVDWKIGTGGDVEALLEPQWQAVGLRWDYAPAGATVARIDRDFDIDLADADVLCLRVSHADTYRLSMWATVDGEAQLVVDRAPGLNRFAELEGPVSGRRLDHVRIEIATEVAGDGRVDFLWLIAVCSSARARNHAQTQEYDPAWPLFLHGDDRSLEPVLGLFLPEGGVDGLRRRAASDTYRAAAVSLRKQADGFAGTRPEAGVRQHFVHADGKTSGRYGHDPGPAVSEREGISVAAMRVCSLAALVDNHGGLARIALRHALSAMHCEYWDDSFMMTRPGALWDHRAFTPMGIADSFVRCVDWAGALLTSTGLDLVARALSLKVLPKVDYSLRKYGYMRHNNQAIFFASTGILAVTALGRLLEHGADGLDWYLDVLRQSTENYIQPDGGTHEGAAYHDSSCSRAVAGFAAAARYLGRPVEDLLPPCLLRAGNYYRIMASTSVPGSSVNTSDGGRVGRRFALGALPFLARATGDEELGALTATLLRPDAHDEIQGAGELLANGPDTLPEPDVPAPIFHMMSDIGMACSNRRVKGSPVRIQFVGAKAHAGHGHEDKGSIVVEAFGEELLCDRGTCFYGDVRSQLLKFSWRHNTLTPNDAEGRPLHQTNPLPVAAVPEGHGDERTLDLTIDLRPAWPEWVSECTRAVTSDDPGRIEVIDHCVLNEPRSVSVHFNSRFPWKQEEGGWSIQGERSRLVVAPDWKPDRVESREDLFDSAYQPVYRLSLFTPEATAFDLKTTVTVECTSASS